MLPRADCKVPCRDPNCRRRFTQERTMNAHANIAHPRQEVRYARHHAA